MHFLVEDALLLDTFASPESARTRHPSYDEVTHQDDLAIPILLPENVANNDVPAAFPWLIPSEKRTDLPILTPPKII